KKGIRVARRATVLGVVFASFSPLLGAQTAATEAPAPMAKPEGGTDSTRLAAAAPGAATDEGGPQGALGLPPIDVYGRPIRKSDLVNDPAANPASVTVIKFSDEQKRNLRDYTALFRPITGVSANNFDQGGIGFGFTLRGFSQRSNGGGAAIFIDGVPVNMPSNPLTNGYADLTPLVPELVDRFILTRGPFDVHAGANALGGSLQITTLDAPPSGAVLSGGNFGFGRAFGVVSGGSSAVSGYGSLVGSTQSGYRNNGDLQQINTFDKVLFPLPGGIAAVRAQAFHDTFGAPGFINRALLENGTLSPRDVVNSTDGGQTDLQVFSFNYRQSGDQPLAGNAYVMHSALDRFSNRASTVPTNPDLPGQALQKDDRITFGGALEKYFRWDLPHGMGADLLVGAGVRLDDVKNKLYNSIRRTPGTQTENTDFTLTNPFGYVQADWKPIPWVKVTGGFRYDRLYFDIDDHTRSLSVSPNLGVTQPKAGLVVAALPGLDFFINFGQGFLAPSAIGGQLSRNPDLDASKLTTREIGVQYNSADGAWHFLADAYRTNFSNEILNQPPPLQPVALGPSRRDGFDLEARVRVYREGARTLSIFANYSKVDGELVNRAGGTSIPDVADYLAKYGFDFVLPLTGSAVGQVITMSAAQSWEGPKPLNTTNTLTTKTFSRIDANVSYTNANWKGFSAYLGFIIYPDRRFEETAFTFGTPISVGVSPKAPLTVQGGVSIPF
ncbi:MAG: TonB-dependent receptor, partial [Betaproteobacteria bacterium]